MIIYYSLSRLKLGQNTSLDLEKRTASTRRNRVLLNIIIRVFTIAGFAAILYGLTAITLWERKTADRKRYFDHIDFLLPEYLATFVQGTAAGILFFEMQNADLLPHTINQIPKQISIPGLQFHKDPYSAISLTENEVFDDRMLVPPTVTLIIRTIFDAFCYILLVLLMLLDTKAMKHYSKVFPGLIRPADSEVTTGLLYGALFICALFSDKSFNRLFHWNLATYAGKISFSMYLLHPFSHQIIFDTIFGPHAMDYEQVTGSNSDSNFFDLFIMSMTITWIIATLSYRIVESPCNRFARYFIANYIPDFTKPCKPEAKK